MCKATDLRPKSLAHLFLVMLLVPTVQQEMHSESIHTKISMTQHEKRNGLWGTFRRAGARGAKNSQNALPEGSGVRVQH